MRAVEVHGRRVHGHVAEGLMRALLGAAGGIVAFGGGIPRDGGPRVSRGLHGALRVLCS